MKIIIHDDKASEIFYNNIFYPTGKEVEVSFSDAMRLAKKFNVEMQENVPSYDPEFFRMNRQVAMMADVDVISGWGNVGLNLIKYSTPHFSTALIGRLSDVKDREVLAASRRKVEPGMGLVIHDQPKAEWLDLPFKKKIAVVPWETTRIPHSWVERINGCAALIVPCQQNVECFRDSGVVVPIELMHWGVDTEKFSKIERPQREVFTFGTMGRLSKRKGTDILVRAFLKAFPTEQDVRLICKTSDNFFLWASRDKRVVVNCMPASHEELMRDFFREVDCFVMPTRGEGCGMPIMEAMSTGLPVIVTGWSGPVDFVTQHTGWFIDHTMESAKDFTEHLYHEDCGEWALPSEEHLIQLMHRAYENRDEAKKKGERAADHMRMNFTWDKTILGYKEALEKHL